MINFLTPSAPQTPSEDLPNAVKSTEIAGKSQAKFGELLTAAETTESAAEPVNSSETETASLPWIEIGAPQDATITSSGAAKNVAIEFNLSTDDKKFAPLAHANSEVILEDVTTESVPKAVPDTLSPDTTSLKNTDLTAEPRAGITTLPHGEVKPTAHHEASKAEPDIVQKQSSLKPLERIDDAVKTSPASATGTSSVASTNADPALIPSPVSAPSQAVSPKQGAQTTPTETIARSEGDTTLKPGLTAPPTRATIEHAHTPRSIEPSSANPVATVETDPATHKITQEVTTVQISDVQAGTNSPDTDVKPIQTADATTPQIRDAQASEQKLASVDPSTAPKTDVPKATSSAYSSAASLDGINTASSTSQTTTLGAATTTATSSALNVGAPTVTPTQPTAPIPMMPPQAVAGVVTERLINEPDNSDRIVVQLDPPELGRVAIDFKFDAAGLQTVTITGESPEALKQLRLMHFELLQALEDNGISGSELSFAENTSNQSQQHPAEFSETTSQDIAAEPDFSEPRATRPTHYAKVDSGLDLKL